MEAQFEQWREGLWRTLCGGADGAANGAGAAAAGGVAPPLTPPAAQFACEWLDNGGAAAAPDDLGFLSRAHSKHALYACRVARSYELAQQPQHGSVKHGSGRDGRRSACVS